MPANRWQQCVSPAAPLLFAMRYRYADKECEKEMEREGRRDIPIHFVYRSITFGRSSTPNSHISSYPIMPFARCVCVSLPTLRRRCYSPEPLVYGNRCVRAYNVYHFLFCRNRVSLRLDVIECHNDLSVAPIFARSSNIGACHAHLRCQRQMW